MSDSPVGYIRFNAAISANADILSSDISPVEDGYFHVMAQFATAAKLNFMVSDGTTEKTCVMNNNVNLTAGAVLTFTLLAKKGYTYNWQPGSSITVDVLQVNFVRVAVGA